MIRLVLILMYNICILVIRKLRYAGRYQSKLIERFSVSSSVKLFQNGSIKFGRNIELSSGVDIQVHGNGVMEIGEGTYMNRYCMVSCHKHVKIGSKCMFGPSVKIFDNNHRFSKDRGVSSELNCGSITIGDNCWIASDVILLKGACIGKNCVIGAGCIIDSQIPDCTLVRQDSRLVLTPIC